MRVLDTYDEALLQDGELPTAGDLAPALARPPRLFCRDEAERVVLSAGSMLYLIDLGTLSVIASRRVPFERYFVM